MKALLWALILLAASSAWAQIPACFRSKFAMEAPLRVKHVRLLDGGKLSRQERASVIRELKRQCDCWPCAMGSEVSQQIRDMYQWYGYYQAVAEVDIQSLTGSSYDITAHVTEGPQYRLKQLEFTRVSAFPVSRLRELFSLSVGDLYDTRAIGRGLEQLRHLYATRGYLNFTAVPEATVDSAAGTIGLRIDADEGLVFTIGPLVLVGLDRAHPAGRQLLDAWQPHVGEVFNRDLVDSLVEHNLIGLLARPPQVTYIENPNTRTVAVRLEFSSQPLAP